MSGEESNHKFACNFGCGVTATATIDLGALRKGNGKAQFIFIEWEGTRTDKHIAAYRNWMLDVHQKAAELLPGRILWIFKPNSNTNEIYEFEPGNPYRRTS